MTEILKAIAMLCALHTESHYGAKEIQKMQNSCQKHYVECFYTRKEQMFGDKLAMCIKEEK